MRTHQTLSAAMFIALCSIGVPRSTAASPLEPFQTPSFRSDSARAQDSMATRLLTRLAALQRVEFRTVRVGRPGIGIVTTSAYGASRGAVGIGVGYRNPLDRQEHADGVVALVAGLGNPRTVGIDVSAAILDNATTEPAFAIARFAKKAKSAEKWQ